MEKNEIHILPDDFGSSEDDVMIYFYSNSKSSAKNKVTFRKNMFCMLQQGIKEVQTAIGKETVTNNDLLILTSGNTLMSETIAENGKYQAILIFFGNQTLLNFCAKQGFTVIQKSEDKNVLKMQRDDFLNNFCYTLNLLQQNNIKIDEFKVYEVLGYIQAKYPEIFQGFVSQAFGDSANIKVKQIVDLNANRGLTINELAFLCHMSVSTFKRHFAEIYNMPPQKYLIQVRMAQAKMLVSLHKRPTEIYAELGYENLSSFSHQFKKHFGVSPKQFQDDLLKK